MLILHHTIELGDVIVTSKVANNVTLHLTTPEGVKLNRIAGTIEGIFLKTIVGDMTLSPEDMNNLQKYFKT